MPYQIMSPEFHPVLPGIINQLIRPFKGITVGTGMDQGKFHRILRGQAIEMLYQQIMMGTDDIRLQCGTDRKITSIFLIQGFYLLIHYKLLCSS